jgi:hypothetical protein
MTDAGGIALALQFGTKTSAAVSVGAAWASNTIQNTIVASIDGATVNSTSGNISVLADSAAEIDALAFAGALSVAQGQTALSLSGAGTGSYNTIANTVDASILNGADVDALGNISLSATDSSTITSDSGAVAVALAFGSKNAIAAAIGISIANNDINNQIQATITGSGTTVDAATGGVDLTATSTATIDALTIAGALAAAAGSGGISLNDMATDVDAAIALGASVKGLSSIDLKAQDTSSITADVVGAAIGGAFADSGKAVTVAVAIGVSFAENTIDNDVRAYIDNATVDSSDATARDYAGRCQPDRPV